MPDFDGKEFVNMVEEFVKIEERWIPPRSNCSLYIRPFMFGTDDLLGVKKPDRSKLIVAACSVGPYYTTGFKPVSLYCSASEIRVAPKSTGSYKVGGYFKIYLEIMAQL